MSSELPPQGPAGGSQAYSDAHRGLCPGPPQLLLGTGFWVPEGAAWEGEGSLLAVVSTPCAWGRGQGGRFSTLVCMGSWSHGPPGWPPSRRWLFSSRGVTLREGPGVLGWPRVQVPRLGVFCPPSLASLWGRVSCPHLWLPWGEGSSVLHLWLPCGEGRTEPPAFRWPLPRWREQGLWGPGPALSAGSALQGASPQPWWLLSLRWGDRHGLRRRVPVGSCVPRVPSVRRVSECGSHTSWLRLSVASQPCTVVARCALSTAPFPWTEGRRP